MKELRVKNTYTEPKEVRAAQGVKITAKDLEKAIAGLNLLVAYNPDEVEICKEEVAHELKSALGRIKLQDRGVYVQASTLGSLEALLEFLKTSEIPVIYCYFYNDYFHFSCHQCKLTIFFYKIYYRSMPTFESDPS